jgi:hypothetical protein
MLTLELGATMGGSKNKATYFGRFPCKTGNAIGPRKLPVENDVQVGPVELST